MCGVAFPEDSVEFKACIVFEAVGCADVFVLSCENEIVIVYRVFNGQVGDLFSIHE